MLILSGLWLLVSAFASAQVTWTGSGDGTSWNDAANWSSGIVPGAAADVVLDNSSVPASYDVTLPSGALSVSVSSITIIPSTGNNISLLIPATNTATTALQLTATGDALTLNDGANFINASAANVEIDGNLIIQQDASMDVSAGAGNPLTSIKGNIVIDAAAVGVVTESGTGNPVIELNGNATQTISAGNNALTGNNLDFKVNTAGTVSLLSNLLLPDDLFVEAGTIDVSNSAAKDTLGVKGDLTISGTITESGTSTASKILLNGTSNQNITIIGSGSITGDRLGMILSNNAGATLQSDVILPYRFTLSGGNLTLGNFSLTTTSVDNTVSLIGNHIITNGSGFLVIPNVGASVVIFPVGIDAFSVNQVEIANGSGQTYYVRVEPGVNPPITQPFSAINRTWTINTNSSAANPVPANVTFYYYTGQGGVDFDYTSTVDIGQFITGAWNIIQNNLIPTSNPPQYRAYGAVNSFNTPFIVGNHGAILPIDFFIACKAQKKQNGAVINWDVAIEENVSRYEIEKAIDNNNFVTIAVVTRSDNKLSYSYTDNNMDGGTTIYRIKVVTLDGRIRYSNTVAVLFNTKSFLITSVTPNPLQNNTKLTISSPENTSVRMILYDAQGRVVRQWQQSISDGTNVISFDATELQRGVYFLSANNGSAKTNTVRIIKQ